MKARWLGLVAAVLLLLAGQGWAADSSGLGSSGLDALLGGQGRADHGKKIEQRVFKGNESYSWEKYSAWGKELFIKGFVEKPPTGPAPSNPVSEYFTCVTCHNYEREDPELTKQDPETRFQWIEETGRDLYLLQGASMWGAVNREAFYPDYFKIYHHLCVPEDAESPQDSCGPFMRICSPGCRTMDPGSLEDATQVCSAYCSVGRYLEGWEMDAMMAFFWDQEIRLADLKLSQNTATAVEEVRSLPASDPERAIKLRRLLSGSYPTKADNTYRGIPKVSKVSKISTDAQGRHIAAYSDGETFTGDPERGEKLYALSCARCHGPEVDDVKAKYLSGDVRQFHRMLAKGTRNSDEPYMPNFTLERLSRRQGADILEFLQGF